MHEKRPHACHQLVSGAPENTLDCLPGYDSYSIQVDAYAETASDARDVASAIAHAVEKSMNYVTSWDGEDVESETGLYRVTFTCEFWVKR